MNTTDLYDVLKIEGNDSFSILIYGIITVDVRGRNYREIFPGGNVWVLGEETDRVRVVLCETHVKNSNEIHIRVIGLLCAMISIPEVRFAFAMIDGVYDGVNTMLECSSAEYIYAIAEDGDRISYAYHDVIRKGESWKSVIREIMRNI